MNARDPRDARGLAAYREKQQRDSRPGRQLLGFSLALVALIGVLLVGNAVWRTWHERSAPMLSAAPEAGSGADTGNVAGRLQALLGAGDADSPAGTDPTPVRFEIKPGATAATVAQQLAGLGLVKDADAFRVLLRVQGIDTKLEAGTYELRRTMTAREVASALQKGRPPSVTITIPEGWRAEEIAALIASQGLADSEEFMRLVKSGEGFTQSFLPQQGATSGLEGYLFPDTYTFDATASDARKVINRLLDNFGAKVGPDLQQAAATSKLGSLQTALALAAIVEREARIAGEQPLIGGSEQASQPGCRNWTPG
ncbi:MAG: endolytic transglycosylase MltG [Anaerolineae bacterium]|nr:endolytic transglycosylase MltG [Anaerolineae bacterium]